MLDRLTDLEPEVARALRNPFREADASLPGLEELPDDATSVLAEALRRGDTLRAEALVLAIAHIQACANPEAPERVLDSSTIPRTLDARLPRPRPRYRRLALAAARAHRALEAAQGSSPSMQEARAEIWAACFGESLLHSLALETVIRDQDILILGETGTGKEVLAQAVMSALPGPPDGSPAPASAINAAAIPDSLVESELFGHVRGAFTGARDNRAGRLRAAHQGVFFLDEVGDLPLTTQVKLLRVIETDRVYPVGSDQPHEVDIRYVAATHKDLAREVEQGSFRQDLFERLAGNVIFLPPLRERPEDIVDIGLHFLHQCLPDPKLRHLAESVEEWLQSPVAQQYPWPGNVRELQNAIRNLLLGLEPDLKVGSVTAPTATRGVPSAVVEGRASLEQVTSWYLVQVLSKNDCNLARTARVLGVDRSTVHRRVKREGLLARARGQAGE